MNIALVDRYIKILLSYYTGKPLFKPDTVSMIVTNNCNLKCYMCEFWKDKKSGGEVQLSLDEYKKIFYQFKEYGVKRVQFTGGEPLLNKDIFNLLQAVKTAGLDTMMVTNGTLITDDNAVSMVRYLDTLYISVDAPCAEVQDKVRGVSGTFEKIKKGIERLISIRSMQKDCSMKIVLVSTMTPESFHDPKDMEILAKDMGVDRVIYNSASTVQYAYTILNNKFSENKDHLVFKRYNEMVDNILKLMEQPDSKIKANPFYLECSREFIKGNEKFYHIPCYGGGYNGALIALDGEVFPCCAWNFSLGNLKNQSFESIWESEKIKEVRKKIKAGKCPKCFHHTRTFDYIIRGPFLIKDIKKLYRSYKTIGSF